MFKECIGLILKWITLKSALDMFQPVLYYLLLEVKHEDNVRVIKLKPV